MPNNCVLAIAGAVESASCLAAVEKCFAALPMACLEPVLVDQEPPQLAQRCTRQHADYQVMRGAIAYKVPHLSHADATSLDALAFALGGGGVLCCGSAYEMKKIACTRSIVEIGTLETLG